MRHVPFRLESAHSGSPPAGAKVGGVRVACFPKLRGEVQKRAEQGGAIVVQQLDQVGFNDEATEFDQATGSFTSCLGPIAGVGSGAIGIEAVTLHHQPP